MKIETQTQVLTACFVANLLKNNALSFILAGFIHFKVVFYAALLCFEKPRDTYSGTK